MWQFFVYTEVMQDFNGFKIVLLNDNDKILVYLRDNKPGLYMANKWDLPGGGKENNEAPVETAIREIEEEFGVRLSADQFIYKADYESERFPGTISKFMVGRLSSAQIENISFGSEGQQYKFIPIDDYLMLDNAVTNLRDRLKDYLAQ